MAIIKVMEECMKKLLFTVILLLVAYSLFAQFRDTKWGMSRQEVKLIEESQVIDEAESGVGGGVIV